MDTNIQELRTKAISVAYGGIFALFIIGYLLNTFVPQILFGIPRLYIILPIILISWFVYLTKTIPRCPKCGMGLLSLIEVGRVPVVLKSWVGKNCAGCGESFEP